jgi:hypothetical protein
VAHRQWTAQLILATLEQHCETLQRMGVRSIGLFGSYVRGTATADSDMDFLVEFERSSFDDYTQLRFFLEDLFECSVDLVLAHTVKPRLRPYILEEVAYVQGLPAVPRGHSESGA